MERRIRAVLLIERMRNNPHAAKELGLVDNSHFRDVSSDTNKAQDDTELKQIYCIE